MSEQHPNTPPAGERLAKRVAALRPCSRAEAERLIEGGWVCVDGNVADDPARRITHETVTIDPEGRPDTLEPVTLLWHKPAGVALHDDQPLAGLIAANGTLRPWHLKHLRCVSPMSAASSGLAVFAQSAGVLRKLREDGPLLEHEWTVETSGALPATTLTGLQPPAATIGSLHIKWSINSQNAERTRLRVVTKRHTPTGLAQWLQQHQLQPRLLHRLRLGRVALGPLAVGEWRVLAAHERF